MPVIADYQLWGLLSISNFFSSVSCADLKVLKVLRRSSVDVVVEIFLFFNGGEYQLWPAATNHYLVIGRIKFPRYNLPPPDALAPGRPHDTR